MVGNLGRVLRPPEDPRDADHPFSAALPATIIRPRSKVWRRGHNRLNQGNTPHCVGFAGANWEQALPTYRRVDDGRGHTLYNACKAIDGIPNEDGTYDRALMKVLQQNGQVGRYLWAQTMDELLDWLATNGTVLIGAPWYSGFDNPDAQGVVRLTGFVRGGHEWHVLGADFRKGIAVCENSWGKEWALSGRFYVPFEAIERLVFQDSGDACTAIEQP